jgi:TRAP-type mannitol/chloroaromatic compound transport system substrate-binding protein
MGAAFLSASLASAVGSADAKTYKMATSWGGGPHLEDLAKGLAEKVKFLTNGEVEFEVFPGGTMGSPLKVVETVRSGVTEAGHHWSGYDWGVDKTAVLFGGYAGSMPEEYYMHWLFAGEGRQPLASGREILPLMRTLEAVRLSAREGRPVAL